MVNIVRKTPLMLAVEYQQIAVIRYLITVPSISFEVPDSEGYTALLMAIPGIEQNNK